MIVAVVSFGLMLIGVVLACTANRFPSQAARLEWAGGFILLSGLALLGFRFWLRILRAFVIEASPGSPQDRLFHLTASSYKLATAVSRVSFFRGAPMEVGMLGLLFGIALVAILCIGGVLLPKRDIGEK